MSGIERHQGQIVRYSSSRNQDITNVNQLIR